jgi:hypothetical protein
MVRHVCPACNKSNEKRERKSHKSADEEESAKANARATAQRGPRPAPALAPTVACCAQSCARFPHPVALMLLNPSLSLVVGSVTPLLRSIAIAAVLCRSPHSLPCSRAAVQCATVLYRADEHSLPPTHPTPQLHSFYSAYSRARATKARPGRARKHQSNVERRRRGKGKGKAGAGHWQTTGEAACVA